MARVMGRKGLEKGREGVRKGWGREEWRAQRQLQIDMQPAGCPYLLALLFKMYLHMYISMLQIGYISPCSLISNEICHKLNE